MSTMPLAQQGAAGAPEAHPAAQTKNGPVCLVLVDEGLQRSIDDIGLALEAGHGLRGARSTSRRAEADPPAEAENGLVRLVLTKASRAGRPGQGRASSSSRS